MNFNIQLMYFALHKGFSTYLINFIPLQAFRVLVVLLISSIVITKFIDYLFEFIKND